MVDRRTLRSCGYAGVGLGGALGIALLPFLLLKDVATERPLALSGISLVVAAQGLAVAWAFVFATLSFDAVDEFVRYRSRSSWYWGGLAGIAASVPIYSFVALGGLHWFFWSTAQADQASYSGRALLWAFSMGYSLLLFMQLGGFFVAWIWWRVSKQ